MTICSTLTRTPQNNNNASKRWNSKMKETYSPPAPSFGEAKSKCLKTCAGTRYPLFRPNKRWKKKKKRKNTEKSKTKLVRRTGYTGCRCSKLALHKHIRPVTADDGNARVTTHPNTTSQQAAGHAENGKHTQPSGPSRENRLNREMGERRERERETGVKHTHTAERTKRRRGERKERKKQERERERKRSSSAASFLCLCSKWGSAHSSSFPSRAR